MGGAWFLVPPDSPADALQGELCVQTQSVAQQVRP